MFRVIAAVAAATVLALATPAEARRIALVIGQGAYPGGASATVGLSPLANAARDARAVAALLGRHGFEVVSCDGNEAGCFDLDRTRLIAALADLEAKAEGADTALVYFAGHGMATEEGNILTPTDATVSCATGAVTRGVPVEQVMAATAPARNKLVILDACRDNPIGAVCPGLADKKLSFTRIEAGAMQDLLVVTSTQFGQEALDGPPGQSSPFAAALVRSLAAHPGIYFEQVMNEVARDTHAAAQSNGGFQQIPGKVVGGAAPADCLAGKNCVGDPRMAALAQENERLTADASALRAVLADEERRRGKPYTPEERQAAVARIGRSLTSLAGSSEPKVQEASRLFGAGRIAEGRAKLDEALDDDEKAAAEIERLARERRRTLARNARDAAGLARGTDLVKALGYYERATRNDPDHAQTWDDYARAAIDAGRLDVAKAAFEQAALKARDTNEPRLRYWATLGLGDVAVAQGSLPSARRLYETAAAIVEPLAKADPATLGEHGSAMTLGWQRDLSVSHIKVGDVLVAQGQLAPALTAFRDSLAIADRLAKADPATLGEHGSAMTLGWQRDLSVSYDRVGDVLVAQGQLAPALTAFRDSLAIRDRLARADPGNAGWQRDLSVSYDSVGDVLVAQGQLAPALTAFRDSLAIRDRLAKADPGNAGWQRDLAISNERVGDILVREGKAADAIAAFEQALGAYRSLVARNPDDLPSKVNSVVPLWRLGGLKGRAGRADLEAALAILKPLAAAGRLDARRAGWIPRIEAQIAALEK